MNESKSSNVVLAEGGDPAMLRAYEAARDSFRYFWREVAMDRRRIVPALSLAAVKAPFSDGDSADSTSTPQVEHMWLSEIDFDGQFVSGVLANTPNWLKSVKEGDTARFLPIEISDWMYAISDDVYGGFTVNLLRFRMTPQERRGHDDAWGLNFGDPTKVRVVAGLDRSRLDDAFPESLREQLAKNPGLVTARSDRGWTLLHQDALAGNAATVKVLLEAGADPDALTDHGMTAKQLAESLGWDEVVALLRHE